MNLHYYEEDFNNLAVLTAQFFNISVDNVKRDYYIVLILKQLSESIYFDKCVFKGGTSLSKCYPGSINRFSEDIDLTFIPNDSYTQKSYDKFLKNIENIMTKGFEIEKIATERNQRNKSSWVWFSDKNLKIKLEIGCSVRPDPYHEKNIKSYIQEYLENNNYEKICDKFNLKSVKVNALDIERTFLDKIMAVKRHALCGSLNNKVRHIYDVVMLYKRDDIQTFLKNKDNLKILLNKTKTTDDFYVKKRIACEKYDALGSYAFETWKYKFDDNIKNRYLKLPSELLFSKNINLSFEEVLTVFEEINNIFKSIGE